MLRHSPWPWLPSLGRDGLFPKGLDWAQREERSKNLKTQQSGFSSSCHLGPQGLFQWAGPWLGHFQWAGPWLGPCPLCPPPQLLAHSQVRDTARQLSKSRSCPPSSQLSSIKCPPTLRSANRPPPLLDTPGWAESTPLRRAAPQLYQPHNQTPWLIPPAESFCHNKPPGGRVHFLE